MFESRDASIPAQYLKKLTNKMAEAKKLIKEFERLALSEGTMEPEELANAKKEYVSTLNKFVQMKKDEQAALTERASEKKDASTSGAGASTSWGQTASTSAGFVDASTSAFSLPAFKPKKKGEIVEDEQLMQMEAGDLIQHGRNVMDETDASIMRSEQVVEETIQIGTQTAEALRGQTTQLEKVVDDLDEIHFSLKKSFGVLKALTRGLATDKCIMLLLFLVVAGVLTVIILRFVKKK